MTERPCFYAKPKTYRERGCKKPAKFRIVFGEGRFMDVCEDHVVGFRGMGYKILELEEVEA